MATYIGGQRPLTDLGPLIATGVPERWFEPVYQQAGPVVFNGWHLVTTGG